MNKNEQQEPALVAAGLWVMWVSSFEKYPK